MSVVNHRWRRAVAAVATTLAVAGGTAGAAQAASGPSPHVLAPASPVTAPSAPRSLSATAGNARVKLTWLAPSNRGGARIDKYVVQRAVGGRWKNVAYRTIRSYTVTGLVNGHRYSFRVRAHNRAGWGAFSRVVRAVPHAVVPTAPRSLKATPGDGTVSLAWLAPATNGGAIIDKYAVQRATSAGGPFTSIAFPTSPSYSGGGLVNGTSYWYRVRAHNSRGWGAPSTVVTTVPRTVPTEPQWPSAMGGNATVTLTWAAPSNNGGSPIDGYSLEQAPSAAGPWHPLDSTTASSYQVNWLTNGTTYYFRIAAHNAAGWSGPSTVVEAMPRTVPMAPLLYSATPGNGTVELKWLGSANNGGFPVDGYYVQRAPSAAGPWVALVNTTNFSYTANGLTPGTTYYFRVVAHSAAGFSDPSAALSATTPPVVPSKPTCSAFQAGAGSHTMQINWNPPASDGGAAITGYKVTVYALAFPPATVFTKDVPASPTTLSVPNLNFGIYGAAVRGVNQAGTGPECEWAAVSMQP